MATRSDYAYYPKLWQKSFLLEIIDKQSKLIVKSFAFSLPPESVSMEFPQRLNITKTFGGVFIDDYGEDSVPISISGSTGNGQLKEVYITGASQYMAGKDEAYYILEEILQYKRGKTGYEKWELRLYDLSSVAYELYNPSVSKALNVAGWVVVLKNGKIIRSKDKPLFYSYSLDFLGIEPIGTKHYKTKIAYTKSFLENVYGAIDKIKNSASSLKKILASYKEVVGYIKVVESVLDSFTYVLNDYSQVVQGFISTTVDGVHNVFDIVSFPSDMVTELIAAVGDIKDSVETSWAEIQASWTDVGDKYENISTVFNEVFEIESSANEIAVVSKSQGVAPSALIVTSDSAGSTLAVDKQNPTADSGIGIILVYGSYDYTATSETRLDVLSNYVYGTPDYADTIAAYNGITGDDDIFAGMILRIPILTSTPAISGNEVYDSSQSLFGVDVLLSSDGDLQLAEFNDYMTVSGVNNVGQAIDLRLSERNGARIRLEAYGIRVAGGGYDALSLAVLASSIKETVLQDPRIRSVLSFQITPQGDALTLTFDVVLESGGTATFTTNL